jgi:hypothetical protein
MINAALVRVFAFNESRHSLKNLPSYFFLSPLGRKLEVIEKSQVFYLFLHFPNILSTTLHAAFRVVFLESEGYFSPG